ncbi:PaaI family thioesterase [Phenylobacterium zucineum]|uniref:PaaI family thioesterase n=1 Tax=Phenylobacterium zucineum TaxID=284016 RepID=UPI0002E7D3B7|nr:PaaI family thioesterase [Phenylobacterium zucineum]
MSEEIPAPPEGFVRSELRGPFSTHNGPYFHRVGGDPETVGQAFYALPRHANGIGLVHGGMLSAFMDGLLAQAVGRKTKAVGVTIHLSIDFLHMARQGEWVVGEARMTRAAKDVAFAEGVARSRGVDVVRASGIFKLMSRHG